MRWLNPPFEQLRPEDKTAQEVKQHFRAPLASRVLRVPRVRACAIYRFLWLKRANHRLREARELSLTLNVCIIVKLSEE